jgi:hypothetical protein
MEIVEVLLLVIIAIEGALLIYSKDEAKEQKVNPRREIYGTFHNPLGDSYRKNKGLYVPIKPNSKMLDGDDEE